MDTENAEEMDPAEHWGTAHPDEQPSYAAVAGLGRLAMDACSRLGAAATPEAVAAELRAAGVNVEPAEVARFLEKRS